jgi:hypothetical protein
MSFWFHDCLFKNMNIGIYVGASGDEVFTKDEEDINLFTDIFHNYTTLDGVVGGFTPRVSVSEPHMTRPYQGILRDIKNRWIIYKTIRNANILHSRREKYAVIFCMLAWAFGWLVIIPYASWILYQILEMRM